MADHWIVNQMMKCWLWWIGTGGLFSMRKMFNITHRWSRPLFIRTTKEYWKRHFDPIFPCFWTFPFHIGLTSSSTLFFILKRIVTNFRKVVKWREVTSNSKKCCRFVSVFLVSFEPILGVFWKISDFREKNLQNTI